MCNVPGEMPMDYAMPGQDAMPGQTGAGQGGMGEMMGIIDEMQGSDGRQRPDAAAGESLAAALWVR